MKNSLGFAACLSKNPYPIICRPYGTRCLRTFHGTSCCVPPTGLATCKSSTEIRYLPSSYFFLHFPR